MWRSAILLACFLGGASAARAQNPVPTIYQPLIPGAVAPGSGGFELEVNGTGFVSGAAIRWNGAALATTFVSSSRLTAQVPAADVANAGTASVTVTNPGTAVASNAILFPVVTASRTVYFDNAPGSPIFLGGVDATANAVQSMASGDFNNDGKPDLALAVEEDHQPGFVMMFLGKGDGTFTQVTPSSPPPLGQGPNPTAAGDFNDDGKTDLAVANFYSNTVSILLGKGDGTFVQAPGSPISVGKEPDALAVGDFNADGRLDVAVGNFDDNSVTILLGNGDGTFTAAPGSSVALSGVIGPAALTSGDFNGDGKLDLAVATFDGASVDILLGHGDGTFTLAPGSPVDVRMRDIALAVGDFNGDGKLDLAVGNGHDDTVTILLGNGDGTFSVEPNCCGAGDPENSITLAMASGDFNGDGKPDLAITVQNIAGSNPVDYVQLFLGNGDGTFTPTDYSLLVPNDPFAMAVGDFNDDGKVDFATGSSPFQDLTVLLQTPPPSTPPDFNISVETSSSTLTVQPGSTATAAVDVSSLANFTGSVALACSGVPSDATCTVGPTPSMVLPPGATGYFKINIATTAPSLAPPGDLGGWPRGAWPALWAFGLGILVMLTVVLARRRSSARGRVPPLALGAIAALLAMSASCGGGATQAPTPPPPTGGTPTGNYTITVKGTSGTIAHSATFTLDVQ